MDVSGSMQTTTTVMGSYNYQSGGFFDGGDYLAGGGDALNIGGVTRTFQANKGVPIMHNMTLNGSADNSVYAVCYVLERIE
jgi:hypothetical protein